MINDRTKALEIAEQVVFTRSDVLFLIRYILYDDIDITSLTVIKRIMRGIKSRCAEIVDCLRRD